MSTQQAVVEQGATGATVWTIDPAHTSVEFSAKHMMITTVKGRLPEVKGAIRLDAANPERSSVEVELATASIDTGVEQRDAHLRSADFLDADTYPSISFRSTRVEGSFARPGDSFQLAGELTIKGTTRGVTLDGTFEGTGKDPWGGERVSFSAETQIDRQDFGLTWNAALETGGVLVSNQIRIALEVQAVKAA